MKYLLIFLFTINTCFANDAQILKQGQPAPFDGFIMTREKVEKIYGLDIDLTSTRKINTLLTEENTLIKNQLTTANTHIDSLSKQLIDQRDNSVLAQVGYFLLGAGMATAVAYAASRAVR